jgi:hypothetical protein
VLQLHAISSTCADELSLLWTHAQTHLSIRNLPDNGLAAGPLIFTGYSLYRFISEVISLPVPSNMRFKPLKPSRKYMYHLL